MTDSEAIDLLAKTVGTLVEIVERTNERVWELESDVAVLKAVALGKNRD